jgi:hypothetical protein
MIIQVIIRLTLYIDQVIIRDGKDGQEVESLEEKSRQGIDNTVRMKIKHEMSEAKRKVIKIFFSHTYVRPPTYCWNMPERQCLCGCLLRDYIYIMWLQLLFFKVGFHTRPMHCWDGVAQLL